MNMQTTPLIRRLYVYQKERFPLAVLGLSLFPAILSSGAIVASHPAVPNAVFVLVASVAYLLHIRVIDEQRDFAHDSIHHHDRPVQTGLISHAELRGINICSIGILIGIALISGGNALLVAFAMLCYSSIAGRDFFLGERIRKHFFLYNGINLVQMLLMQLFVYVFFTNALPWGPLFYTHAAFTTVGTILFEFIRKLKIPGSDGTGKDTYTSHMGFHRAMIVYLLLIMLQLILFAGVINLLSAQSMPWLIFSLSVGTVLVSIAIGHWIHRKRFTDQLLQLSVLLSYGVLNLVLYFVKNAIS